MIDKYETIIKKQQETNELLQEQLEAGQVLINIQKQQIKLLEENVAALEKEKVKLMDAGNNLFQSNGQLEEICANQQALLEELSDMMKQPQD